MIKRAINIVRNLTLLIGTAVTTGNRLVNQLDPSHTNILVCELFAVFQLRFDLIRKTVDQVKNLS